MPLCAQPDDLGIVGFHQPQPVKTDFHIRDIGGGGNNPHLGGFISVSDGVDAPFTASMCQGGVVTTLEGGVHGRV